MNYQAVFWDFDGVVLDSVNVKTRAFACMFSKYGTEIEKAVVDYHLAHGGVSRFEKFRYYYKKLLRKAVTDAEIAILGEEFSRLALEGVLSAPFIPGAFESLRYLKHKGVPCYVVSGTPEVEVQHIVRQRGLSGFFAEVHGAPRKKVEIVQEILHREKYDAFNCVFLGDAMTDYEAAYHAGMEFIGVVSAGEESIFPEGTRVTTTITFSKEM